MSVHCFSASETLLGKQIVSVDSGIKIEFIIEFIMHGRKLVICERITFEVADTFLVRSLLANY